MTEAEFRAQFDADRNANRMTWVQGDIAKGIAVGIDSAKAIILLHGGGSIPFANASFVPPPWAGG